ncbi:MAG: efflux RND transporter periplasmic adaptor subunit [Sulfurospirillaceae bacterium]|nr:efflux RND transporter periplasmic adaptor subunit [Sulfurospirillaceae bacterium]
MKKIILLLLLLMQALLAEEVYATFDVVSNKSSDLGLSVSGVVGSLYVDVGDTVKKGTLLLSLKNDQEQQEVNSARTAVAIAQKYAEHSQKIYDRYAKISDVIDKEKMENYIYNRDINALNLKNALNTLHLREIQLAKTQLRAPYDLVVTKKMTELGNIVLGSQTKLLSVTSPKDIKLVLKFDEKYWKEIKIGQKFTYKVDGSNMTYQGTISKIYPTVIQSTRKMQAEVKAFNLMPGLFGSGMITVK